MQIDRERQNQEEVLKDLRMHLMDSFSMPPSQGGNTRLNSAVPSNQNNSAAQKR